MPGSNRDNPVDRDFLFSTPFKEYRIQFDELCDNPVDRDFLFSTKNYDQDHLDRVIAMMSDRDNPVDRDFLFSTKMQSSLLRCS